MIKSLNKNIIDVKTFGLAVKTVKSYGQTVWENGIWVLDVNGYIDKGDGFYYQKFVKYGEIIPGVKFETPASTYTPYDFIDDTESTYERKPGIKYLMSNNKGKDNSWAQVKLSWEDIEDWELGYMSDAESNYDYIVVSEVDAPEWTSNPSTGLYSTKGKQNTELVSSFSGAGSHHIYVAFRKDGSGQRGKDRGYIYFPEDKKEIIDTKAGNKLPYTYEDYGDVIVENDGYYKKLIYTAQLPNGSYVTNQDNYIKGEKLDVVSEYGGLAFEAVNESTVSLTLKPGIRLYYSIKNKSPWIPFDATSEISLTNSETMYVMGINPETDSGIKFKLLGGINASGNVMSIYYGDGFDGKVTPQSTDINGMAFLFSDSTGLLRADELILPLTKLNTGYYKFMFSGCRSLTTAPALPATELGNECYSNMFKDCRSLTTAPALPATELKEGCYEYMFRDCTSLTTPPALPATTLKSKCYSYMFLNCSSLTTSPAIPATTLTYRCYEHMFQGCTSLTATPELPATKLADECYGYMFYFCTSLTTAPELPATELDIYCYRYMFQDCRSLTTAPVLPATILPDNCYYGMFDGCSNLNDVTCYANTKGSNSLSNWLNRVSSSGTFHKLGTLEYSSGPSGIPSGWTILEEYKGLTFTAMEDGCSITYQNSDKTSAEYSKDGVNWQSYNGNISSDGSISSYVGIRLNKGEKLYVRGTIDPAGQSLAKHTKFVINGNVEASGNINSLNNNSDVLPPAAYADLFNGCTSLMSAPELPSVNLSSQCYYRMFKGCTNLNYIKANFVTEPSDSYTGSWLDGVALIGTFVANPEATWTTSITRSTSTVPENWTIQK